LCGVQPLVGDLAIQHLGDTSQEKIPYIIDIDDYWVIPRHNPAYQVYRKVIKNCIKDAIYYADAVMTTTPQLASVISPLTKTSPLSRTALDYSHEQWNKPPTTL
jgi:hypothetical protein